MLINCLLVALVYMIGNMDVRYFGAHRINWPIFLAPVVGLVCGDMKTGIIMGVELQLIFLGFVAIGMSTLPDGAAGTTLAVTFAILNGMDANAAIALAMPIALLFQPLQIIKNAGLNFLNVWGDKYAKDANYKGVEWCLRGGNIVSAIFDFVPMFIILFIGAGAVESLIDILPTVVMNCLNKTAEVLPALGIAYLMSYVADGFTLPFVFLGFGLSAYLGMDALGTSLIGGVIAVVYFNVKKQKSIEG